MFPEKRVGKSARWILPAFLAFLTLLVGKTTMRGQVARPGPVSIKFAPEAREPGLDPRYWLLSPETVVDAQDGSVRLAHSVLVADEMGATDFRQGEELTDRTWAKKTLSLDSADANAAELFVFGGAREIRFNDKPLGPGEPLVSTGWTRVKVPTPLLQAGQNEVVFRGPGSLLIEPGKQPGRSSKSGDAGRTWSKALGGKDNQPGEYVVRLRLGRFAPHGWTMSPVFDLWPHGSNEPALAGKIVAFHALAQLLHAQPAGTRVVPRLRTGSTPSPDGKTWTEWISLERDVRPGPATAGHRWAQLKFDLYTDRPQSTARLPSRFDVALEFAADPVPVNDQVIVGNPNAQDIKITSVPFIYQEPMPRLKLLRERYRLDKVVAPGKTEIEKLMLLRHWVRNQWHTAWGSHPAGWMPPWDALVILESRDQPDCLTMCTHYAAVLTQCCLALGWNARHCILDHHCVSEVYVNQHRKWVMMDAGNSGERADVTLHYERNGAPLSARELHEAYRAGRTSDIQVCFTPAKLRQQIASLCRPITPAMAKLPPHPDVVSLGEAGKLSVGGLETYRRYAFPGRNTYLDSPLPGELYQGWSHYFYDGYWWVGDSPDDPKTSPEYSRHLTPARPQDMDWDLNWTRIHLARTAKPGELQVDLETLTPNLGRLEKATGADAASSWQTTPASFVWKLKPGANVLRFRSVNRFEVPGVESSAKVQWQPQRR